jgi:hypothetical protein
VVTEPDEERAEQDDRVGTAEVVVRGERNRHERYDEGCRHVAPDRAAAHPDQADEHDDAEHEPDVADVAAERIAERELGTVPSAELIATEISGLEVANAATVAPTIPGGMRAASAIPTTPGRRARHRRLRTRGRGRASRGCRSCRATR